MPTKALVLLLEYPQDPVFMPKGENRVAFTVPVDYVEEKHLSIAKEAHAISGNRSCHCQFENDKFTFTKGVKNWIDVKKIAEMPNLTEILELERNANFSLFVPKHQRLACLLIDIFMNDDSLEDLMSVAVYAHDRVNQYLFNYALSVALLHRPDTQGCELPTFLRSFPDKFTNATVFKDARTKKKILPKGAPIILEIPKDHTASDLEEEHRVAYFREDIGVSLHHWHWHLVYPPEGKLEIVKKDRRGELFYYMHQQILARYNFERFCNKLPRVQRFSDWRKPIKEGYFPKLNSNIARMAYPAREANQKLHDVNRPTNELKVDIADLERWRDRIYDAIHKKTAIDQNGEPIKLTDDKGIDILGNMVEATMLSPDKDFYGNLHIMGHNVISYIHDPDFRYLECFGVMGDVATAMRDPIFYRWHSFIDDIFQTHKNTLPPYKKAELKFKDIKITKISILSNVAEPNVLNTFWQQTEVDLSAGVDFSGKNPVLAKFTHLQHRHFVYKIEVNNKTETYKTGTCRIFLAPKLDERGDPWNFSAQRNMFIELDKFKVSLKPCESTIKRLSTLSSVTIPFKRTFQKTSYESTDTAEAKAKSSFCGCGWPHHMLLPKGSLEGMDCQLFIMISDYESDQVVQDMKDVCADAGSYCGVKDKLYPDRRAMGYPFDRIPRKGVKTFKDFRTQNMALQDVRIKFENRTIKPGEIILNREGLDTCTYFTDSDEDYKNLSPNVAELLNTVENGTVKSVESS